MPGWISVPNAFTAARIVLAPVFLWRYVVGDEDGALIAFAAAALTDGLDGLMARLLAQQTQLGAFLDAAADKLLMACALVALAVQDQVPWWLAGIVVGRDALLALGSVFLAFRRAPIPVRPTRVGKYAMALVAFIVVVVLVADHHDAPASRTGPWIVALGVVASALVAWSAVQYASSFVASARLVRRAHDATGR
ncbi:MAG TPA: CDP-alcohol phosphatidyltransferase family protein [Anaeromyxobacteraceae bacterium]|nr:CDP-alcohol phosphatidyltransferase family protein [Anaeromyxobacteraceae bacterium]